MPFKRNYTWTLKDVVNFYGNPDNGTPYTEEQWKKWYAHKSNKEQWIEDQEKGDDNE